jgi:hypothetical protein
MDDPHFPAQGQGQSNLSSDPLFSQVGNLAGSLARLAGRDAHKVRKFGVGDRLARQNESGKDGRSSSERSRSIDIINGRSGGRISASGLASASALEVLDIHQ